MQVQKLQNLHWYREAHPGTRVGAAGATQGFNTGVTLYDLASMRQRQGQGVAMVATLVVVDVDSKGS